MQRYSGIVQSVEQRTVNPYVVGSSPTARAKISADFCGFSLLLLHEPPPNTYVFVCQKWAFFYKKTHI